MNPPASLYSLAKLESMIGLKLSQSSKELYSCFDGFEEDIYDCSDMNIWSVDRIIRYIDATTDRSWVDQGVPIADFFIGSELLICRLWLEGDAVCWGDRHFALANSLRQFVLDLSDGKYE